MTPTLQDRALKAMDELNKAMAKDLTFAEHQCNLSLDVQQHWETIREALRLAADPDMVYVPRIPNEEMMLAWNNLDTTNMFLPSQIIKAEYSCLINAAAPVATTEGK